MEFIEEYKGFKILRDKETTFFKLSPTGGDISCIVIAKKMIDILKNNGY
jgi:hypothetical protein